MSLNVANSVGREVCYENPDLDENDEDQEGNIFWVAFDNAAGCDINPNNQKRHDCEWGHTRPVSQVGYDGDVQTWTIYWTSC